MWCRTMWRRIGLKLLQCHRVTGKSPTVLGEVGMEVRGRGIAGHPGNDPTTRVARDGRTGRGMMVMINIPTGLGGLSRYMVDFETILQSLTEMLQDKFKMIMELVKQIFLAEIPVQPTGMGMWAEWLIQPHQLQVGKTL